MRLKQKTLAIIISVSLILSFNMNVYANTTGLLSFPDSVDPQSWTLQRDMTWEDWKPNPVVDWNTSDVKPERVVKGALILVDFADRPFIVTRKEGSELIGNPVVGGIAEEDLADFWVKFLNTPQAFNNYRSINEYWRENTYGKWSVDLKAFGPYHLEGQEYEYGIDRMNGVDSGSRNIGKETYDMVKATGDVDFDGYDFFFILHSGYDESGVWQELGEMMFESEADVPDEFGPMNEGEYEENAIKTRYVPWTSWYAAKSVWSFMSSVTDDVTGEKYRFSVQGENDGMSTFAHEFGHIVALGDNYNNPYGIPDRRSYSGPWELMSRGAFSGPYGPHTRYMIPGTLGGSAPSNQMLGQKIKQNFTEDGEYLLLESDEIKVKGPIFADVIARAVPIGKEFEVEGIHGVKINIKEDKTPIVPIESDWRADRIGEEPGYNSYTIEVVDRVGYDSFVPDSGVLIAKNKDSERAPHIWVVDAHPEDIGLVDFVRKDGTEAMLSKGDMQQLADACFHAGTGEGVVSEYIDEYNRLHFYILDKKYDDENILSYRVAVRHLDGEENIKRGLKVKEKGNSPASLGNVAIQYFDVTNTGKETDLIRLNASTKTGWDVMLNYNVIEVEAGKTVKVPVYVQMPKYKTGSNILTFTATSETDFEQSITVNTKIQPSN